MADGTLKFDTMLDPKGMVAGLLKAKTQGEGAGRHISKAFLATGAAVAAVGAAAVLTGKKLWKAANEVAEYGDKIDKQSQQVGLSAKAYQQWDYAMNLAGTSMDQCKMGIKTLTNTLDDAANGSASAEAKFTRLGLSVDELKGKTREDVFMTTIKSLQNVKDETERAALANDMFGRSGQALMPLLNQENADLDAVLKQAEEYGLIMSDKAVKASAAFEDSLTKMKGTLTGVKNRMIGDFLPGITMIMDGISDLAVGNKKGSKEIAKGFSMVLKEAGKLAPKVMGFIQQVSQAIIKALPSILPILINGFTGMIKAVLGILPKVIPQIVNGIMGIVDIVVAQLPTILPALINGVVALITALANKMPEYAPHFVRAAVAIIAAVISALPGMWSALNKMVLNLAKKLPGLIKKGIGSLLAIGKSWIAGLWNGISNRLSSLASSLKAKASALKNKVSLGSLYSIGVNFVAGLWRGISARWSSVVSSLKAKVKALPKAVKKVLGIGSPSKVMAEIGQWIPVGFAKGIEDNFKVVDNAMKAMGSTTIGAIDTPTFAAAGRSAGIAARAQNAVTASALQAAKVEQTINFNQPVSTPAETAREMKKFALYGLAGA